jgi:hypothetical protein
MAKNGWDINARPPDAFYTGQGFAAPEANVNDRNLQIANNSSVYLNEDLTVFALGRAPLDYVPVNSLVTMPLVVLDLKMGGGTLYVSHFDFDAYNPPSNMQYTITTVPTALFKMCSKVVASPIPGTSGNCADINQFLQASCAGGTDCNNNWARPQYVMGIPAGEDGYFGGILQVSLLPGRDAVTWSANVTAGRPFLTE